MADSPPASRTLPRQNENLLINLICNILVPTLILTKLSGDARLGATAALLLALAFPLAYGLWDLRVRRKFNLLSALGVISVMLTGGISLLHLAPRYLAIKEAAVPGIFGFVTLLSLRTRYPLVRTLLFNDSVMETDRVQTALLQRDNCAAFERRLMIASCIVAGSFFLSSLLNYLLATFVVTSPAGSAEYNQQLGEMTALSFPVIAVPAMLVMTGALFYLIRGITRLTGLSLEAIIRDQSAPTIAAAEPVSPRKKDTP